MAEITERESTPRILVSALEKGKNPIYFHRATIPPGEASQERMNQTSQGADLRVVPLLTTHELLSLTLCTDHWAILRRLTHDLDNGKPRVGDS